jgi:hypothetical protein
MTRPYFCTPLARSMLGFSLLYVRAVACLKLSEGTLYQFSWHVVLRRLSLEQCGGGPLRKMIALYINCKLMRDSQHVISIAADLVMPAFALSSDVVAFRGIDCLLLHG